MVRIKRTLKRRTLRKKYIIKQRLQTPKTVKFGNKQFTVRFKRISKRSL